MLGWATTLQRPLKANNKVSISKVLTPRKGVEEEMLNNVIKLGGTIMIVKELVDRIRHARSDREQAMRRNRAGMLALGVSIGCTVGAVAGVLFAPRAGKETREEVGRRGSEAWGKIKDNVSTNGQRLVNTLEEQGAHVHKAAEKGVDAVKEVLAETSSKAEKAEPKQISSQPGTEFNSVPRDNKDSRGQNSILSHGTLE